MQDLYPSCNFQQIELIDFQGWEIDLRSSWCWDRIYLVALTIGQARRKMMTTVMSRHSWHWKNSSKILRRNLWIVFEVLFHWNSWPKLESKVLKDRPLKTNHWKCKVKSNICLNHFYLEKNSTMIFFFVFTSKNLFDHNNEQFHRRRNFVDIGNSSRWEINKLFCIMIYFINSSNKRIRVQKILHRTKTNTKGDII